MNTCECQLPQRLHVSTVFCSQRGLCCHRLSSAHHHKALTRGWGWSQHYSRCTKSNKGIKRRSQNWKAQNTNARSFLLLIYARRRISKLFTTAHYHTRAEMSRQRMGWGAAGTHHPYSCKNLHRWITIWKSKTWEAGCCQTASAWCFSS